MANTSDNNDGGPIIGLKLAQIIQAWNEGKNLREIAIETGVPIQQVNRTIKEIEKAVIRPGVKSHAKKVS